MKALHHICSTRRLSQPTTAIFLSRGCRITVHDFVQKTITIPNNITPATLYPDIVLTSKTGVAAFLEIARKLRLAPSAYRIHCLAHATRIAAENAGTLIATTAPDAQRLAREILNKNIQSVTHVCGNRRRPELSDTLKAGRISLTEIIAYQTVLTPVVLAEPFDAILFFSPSAIDSFCAMNPEKENPCFCIGATTAQHAKQAGFNKVFSAPFATEEALRDLVVSNLPEKNCHAEE